MLAPDMNRASLDLVIHHPWLKSYRPSLLDHYYSTTKKATINQSFNSTTVLPQQQRNTTDKSNSSIQSIKSPKPSKSSSFAGKRFIKKAISLLVKGPFPPPKKPYRDLSHLGTRETVFARQKV
ncbi:MAG: hypothetical protein JSY10_25060 [Paenibacillus sp.]|nr:hypothetical protein [Paenibacillus sp.]